MSSLLQDIAREYHPIKKRTPPPVTGSSATDSRTLTGGAPLPQPAQGYKPLIAFGPDYGRSTPSQTSQGPTVGSMFGGLFDKAKSGTSGIVSNITTPPNNPDVWQNAASGIARAARGFINMRLPKPTPVEDTVVQPEAQRPTLPAPAGTPPISATPPQGTTTTGAYNTTQSGAAAQDKYLSYLMQDSDPMVVAERQKVDRTNVLREEQAKRQTHERAVQAGYSPGTPQYEQMMRNAVTDARNQNIAATNQVNEFARQRRSQQQAELENYMQGEYARSSATEKDNFNRVESVLKYLPSDKAQQAALAQALGGQDISKVFQGMYDQNGDLLPQYKDMTQPERVKSGIQNAVDQMAVNPITGVAWKGTEKEDYVNKLYVDNFQNMITPSETQTAMKVEEGAAATRISDFLRSGDRSNLQPSDWKNITPTQISQAIHDGYITKFDGSSYFRMGDWDASGLKADRVESAVDDKVTKSDTSAGAGNGSIVQHTDGRLYRITRYRTKKDTTGINERMGTVWAVPVDGGPEIELSSTGWRRL